MANQLQDSKIRQNTLLMLSYEIFITIVPLITIPYVSRVLGTYGVGTYSFAHSSICYFTALTALGVSMYGKREIASCINREQRSKTFWNIWAIESLMFVLSFIAYVIYILNCGINIKPALWIQLLTLTGVWLDITWFFFGIEDFKAALMRNFLVRITSTTLVFIFVQSPEDTYLYVFILASCDLFSVTYMWIIIRKYVNKMHFDLHLVKKHLSPMFKMFIPAISVQLFSMTDKFLLGYLVDISAVGLYENAYRITKFPTAFITVLGSVMLPRITKLKVQGNEGLINQYFERSFSLTVFVGLGCAFGLIAVSPTLIPVYLGPDFIDSINLIRILSLILIVIAVGNTFRMQFILPNKMDNLYAKSFFFAAMMNVILNLLMIPLFSYYGAAFASLISEMIICVYLLYRIRSNFNYKVLFGKVMKYIISALIMLIVVLLTADYFTCRFGDYLSLFFQITIGFIVYISASLLFELVDKDTCILSEIRRFIKK